MLLALIGFGTLIASYLLGEVLDFAGELSDFGDEGVTDGVVNLYTVSAFVSGFGAVGWLLSGYWGVDPLLSSVGGISGGIPLAALVVVLGRALARQAGSTNFTLDQLVGSDAVVTLRIAPGSVGYIEYRQAGGRHRAVARSNDGALIPEGTIVRVERVVGGDVMVTARNQQAPHAETA
jgi:hypothetical protein